MTLPSSSPFSSPSSLSSASSSFSFSSSSSAGAPNALEDFWAPFASGLDSPWGEAKIERAPAEEMPKPLDPDDAKEPPSLPKPEEPAPKPPVVDAPKTEPEPLADAKGEEVLLLRDAKLALGAAVPLDLLAPSAGCRLLDAKGDADADAKVAKPEDANAVAEV